MEENILNKRHYSREVTFRDMLLQLDFNIEDEIINTWQIIEDSYIPNTDAMIEHFPELRRLK